MRDDSAGLLVGVVRTDSDRPWNDGDMLRFGNHSRAGEFACQTVEANLQKVVDLPGPPARQPILQRIVDGASHLEAQVRPGEAPEVGEDHLEVGLGDASDGNAAADQTGAGCG